MEGWTDFFVATAGASAALAGLVIVAVSVNVGEIIKNPPLPDRAGAAIASLVTVLLASISGLARQPVFAFGCEVLGFGLLVWALHAKSAWSTTRMNRTRRRPLYEALQVVLFGQAQTVPVIVAGALLMSGATAAGTLVLFAAMLAIFALTMLDAWVLLIEILR